MLTLGPDSRLTHAGDFVSSAQDSAYAQNVLWEPSRPRFTPFRSAVALFVGAVAACVASILAGGVHVKSFVGVVEAAALIGVLNAICPPIVAAVRLPFTLVTGFLVVLAVDAGILRVISARDAILVNTRRGAVV